MQLNINQPDPAPKPQNLLHFQNLIPGIFDSQFLNDYKDYLETESNDLETKKYRMDLLSQSPPILTFKNEDALKKFYEEEAKKCGFCCAALGLTQTASGETIDYYMYSLGNGKIYEGSVEEISSQLNAFSKASENSSDKTIGIKAMHSFAKQVSERGTYEQPQIATKLATESNSPNPFETIPRPDNKD